MSVIHICMYNCTLYNKKNSALVDLLYITFQLDADSCSTVLQNQSICTSFNRIVLEVTHSISSPLNAMWTQAVIASKSKTMSEKKHREF